MDPCIVLCSDFHFTVLTSMSSDSKYSSFCHIFLPFVVHTIEFVVTLRSLSDATIYWLKAKIFRMLSMPPKEPTVKEARANKKN